MYEIKIFKTDQMGCRSFVIEFNVPEWTTVLTVKLV